MGCGNDDPDDNESKSTSDVASSDDTASVGDVADAPGAPAAPAPMYLEATWTGAWAPSKIVRLNRKPSRRGFVDLRGIIHAHSPYSHDACDGEPFDKDGNINKPCWEDFRRDFCTVGHDFVFLSDHPVHFRKHEFPDVLLYDKARGDKLVMHDGKHAGNWIDCSGRKQLIMAGSESAQSMPIGLPGHVGDVEQRKKLYSTKDKATFEALQKHGAVVLYAHTEGRSISDLVDLPVQGFEMFNLHANMMGKLNNALGVAAEILDDDNQPKPSADLVFLPLVWEDPAYLTRWGTVMARGKKRVTVMGTDCHRNTLPIKLHDDERVDSYRRMMTWFSNHLLVKPGTDGTWDDRDLKDALTARRVYGVFEFLGFPEGFDFTATQVDGDGKAQLYEMGAEVSLAKGKTWLHVRMPSIIRVDPKAPKAKLVARILRAKEGGWDEVARVEDGDIALQVSKSGAYRTEIRMQPFHLEPHLGFWKAKAKRDLVWIYSNVVYVTD